jgi:hypothetical protein
VGAATAKPYGRRPLSCDERQGGINTTAMDGEDGDG